jgi:CRP-like cAMP-binding protein
MLFGELQPVDVVAVDQCDIYSLSRESFDRIIEDYPDFKHDLLNSAYNERMRRLFA